MENLPLDNFTPILVRGVPRIAVALDTDAEVFLEIAQEVERRLANRSLKGYAAFSGIVNRKDVIQKRLIYDIFTSRRSPVRCAAGRETAVVYADGTVGGCELRSESLGYLPDVDMDIGAIWRGARAKEFRHAIEREACTCWHQCFLSPTIVKSPRLWLSS
jgi:hypothetical protein